MSVGISEWSSSFQHVLQCGVKRLVPADNFQVCTAYAARLLLICFSRVICCITYQIKLIADVSVRNC